MATNVKILLRRGLRNELAGDTLSAGELGYTTDTNQLYVGVEEAINELRFDPFANAHAVIQSWLDSPDCSNIQAGLTVDEDLVVADIDAGKIDSIITALNTYTQTLVFNSSTATFTVGELLTQYRHKRTILTSPNVIPSISSITADFTVEGEQFTPTAQSLADLLSDLQANATLKTKNVISEVVGEGAASKLKFTKIDGEELKITFPATVVTAGAFVIGNTYRILLPGTTDFTLIGSADSNNGTVFTATGVGSGTGLAQRSPTDFTLIGAADNNIGTVFTATGSGTGNGTARGRFKYTGLQGTAKTEELSASKKNKKLIAVQSVSNPENVEFMMYDKNTGGELNIVERALYTTVGHNFSQNDRVFVLETPLALVLQDQK